MLKIGDFGLSKSLNNSFSKAKTEGIGTTPLFIAPELILDQPHTSKVDVWAAGVILYLMCTGKYPFDTKNGTR
jgi:serine/threonine protein kinase